MLYGVSLGSIQHRFFVGAGQPQVKGGHRLRADPVLPGHIQAGLQFDMVNGKGCYLFHDILRFVFSYDTANSATMQAKSATTGS